MQCLDNGYQAGSKRGRHKQEDLDPFDRYADVACRIDIAADTENPVAKCGTQEYPRGQRGNSQPPKNLNRKTDSSNLDVACEDRKGGAIAGCRIQATHLCPAGYRRGEAYRQAAEDKERSQRDDKRRKTGA